MTVDFMSGWDWCSVADGRRVWPTGTGAGETILAGGEDGVGQGIRLPDPGNAQRLQVSGLTQLATRYVGFWWKPESIPAGAGNIVALAYLIGPGASHYAYLRETALLQLELAVNGTTTIIAGTWYHVGLEVFVNAVTGYRKLYLNGVLEAQQTNIDTTGGGAAYTDTIRLGQNDGTLGTPAVNYDHLYSGNANLGLQRIKTRRPTGNGTYAEWAPSAGTNWQNVDEVGSDAGATFNGAGVAAVRDTYTGPVLPTITQVVNAVNCVHIARKGDAAARSIKTLIRSLGVDYQGSALTLAGGFTLLNDVYSGHPGGGAWSPATVNSAEFGLVTV